MITEIPFVFPQRGRRATAPLQDRKITKMIPEGTPKPGAPAPQPGATNCPLSAREIEIVIAVAEGLTNKQAGVKLGISPLTVKSHLWRITDRVAKAVNCAGINVGERSGLVFVCLREGWIVWTWVESDESNLPGCPGDRDFRAVGDAHP